MSSGLSSVLTNQSIRNFHVQEPVRYFLCSFALLSKNDGSRETIDTTRPDSASSQWMQLVFDFLPSINEEDSYHFSDSRSLMSKLPRRVSASAGLPKGVQLGFCTFSKRSFTCLDTTVYSFRSHISPQTSLRDSPPLDLRR